ncbi:MAG TPA: DUF5615 family PIN-like protein [Chitinophagales bacterium]|nr:DUF5615 family PIN-like protein [Chitinophagales bacterium]
MIKIIADENVDFGIVRSLRNLNLEVYSILESQGGIDDESILKLATKENALLITEDKDFGELVYRLKMKHSGVLLIRILDLPREEKIERAVNTILNNIDKLATNFSVLTDNDIRIRTQKN